MSIRQVELSLSFNLTISSSSSSYIIYLWCMYNVCMPFIYHPSNTFSAPASDPASEHYFLLIIFTFAMPFTSSSNVQDEDEEAKGRRRRRLRRWISRRRRRRSKTASWMNETTTLHFKENYLHTHIHNRMHLITFYASSTLFYNCNA